MKSEERGRNRIALENKIFTIISYHIDKHCFHFALAAQMHGKPHTKLTLRVLGTINHKQNLNRAKLVGNMEN